TVFVLLVSEATSSVPAVLAAGSVGVTLPVVLVASVPVWTLTIAAPAGATPTVSAAATATHSGSASLAARTISEVPIGGGRRRERCRRRGARRGLRQGRAGAPSRSSLISSHRAAAAASCPGRPSCTGRT